MPAWPVLLLRQRVCRSVALREHGNVQEVGTHTMGAFDIIWQGWAPWLSLTSM